MSTEPILYMVVDVGCTECNTSSLPSVALATTDFREACDLAMRLGDDHGRQGDAFVVSSDGRIVGSYGGNWGDEWREVTP